MIKSAVYNKTLKVFEISPFRLEGFIGFIDFILSLFRKIYILFFKLVSFSVFLSLFVFV